MPLVKGYKKTNMKLGNVRVVTPPVKKAPDFKKDHVMVMGNLQSRARKMNINISS